MKQVILLPTLMLLSLMLVSCHHNNIDANFYTQYQTRVLFFSNDYKYMSELNYYDALLDLQDKFPTDLAQIKLLSSKNDVAAYHAFQIKETPALVILSKDGMPVTHISGANQTKEEIINEVSHAIESSKKNTLTAR
jgi:hypothetical protein